jgi:hypothetical protein
MRTELEIKERIQKLLELRIALENLGFDKTNVAIIAIDTALNQLRWVIGWAVPL